jgi:hypothetical protein
MIAIESWKLTVRHDAPVYVASEPKESGWGQPPASHYVFRIVGTRLFGEPIAGVYLPSPSSDILSVDSHLAAEFEAWDAASDEALVNFEATLD